MHKRSLLFPDLVKPSFEPLFPTLKNSPEEERKVDELRRHRIGFLGRKDTAEVGVVRIRELRDEICGEWID